MKIQASVIWKMKSYSRWCVLISLTLKKNKQHFLKNYASNRGKSWCIYEDSWQPIWFSLSRDSGYDVSKKILGNQYTFSQAENLGIYLLTLIFIGKSIFSKEKHFSKKYENLLLKLISVLLQSVYVTVHSLFIVWCKQKTNIQSFLFRFLILN